jgi:signal transduction histidine kinase
MKLPPFVKSVRFRLSGMTSAVVFGLGALSLGAAYVAVLWRVRDLTMRTFVLTQQPVELSDGRTVLLPQITEQEIRSVESVIKEIILNQVAWVTLATMLVLFILSLVVGWFFAGRALRPVDRISAVAREIEATDLSRRLRIDGPDDELTRMARTFDAMLDRLDRAFTSQRSFLAQTSHDLRTPLAVIRSNLDVTIDDPDANLEEWRQTGEIVSRAAERMSIMIDGLLAAARLEANETALVEVDLADVVGSSVEEFSASLRSEGIGIRGTARPAVVEGDATALIRAVGNLVDNAVAVSPAGGTITVTSGVVDDWAYLTVSDEGPGIDPGMLDDPVSGGGLGLRIVREIAGLHRGTVEALRPEEDGTTMVLWIPRAGSGHALSAPPGLPGL